MYGYNFDESKCVNCGKCRRTCKMDVDITKTTTSLECIRCGECVSVCPTKALSKKFDITDKKRVIDLNNKTVIDNN